MSAGQKPSEGDRPSVNRELDPVNQPVEMPAPDILDKIVAKTATSLSHDEADPQLKSALLDVARQYLGQPLLADEAGTALLTAVLRVRFPVLASRPDLLAQAARTVVGSLLADPAARLRVEDLWATLQEEAA